MQIFNWKVTCPNESAKSNVREKLNGLVGEPMPTLPLRPCTYSGCPALTATGRCPAHRRAPKPEVQPVRLYDDRRGSSAKRGYDRQWRKKRAAYLIANPWCRKCAAAAALVDHIIPKAIGGTDDDRNLQPLCVRCHNIKTGSERRAR